MQRAQAEGHSSEWWMLLRRLRVYKFTVAVPPPPQYMCPCPHCFVTWVATGQQAWLRGCRRPPSTTSSLCEYDGRPGTHLYIHFSIVVDALDTIAPCNCCSLLAMHMANVKPRNRRICHNLHVHHKSYYIVKIKKYDSQTHASQFLHAENYPQRPQGKDKKLPPLHNLSLLVALLPLSPQF